MCPKIALIPLGLRYPTEGVHEANLKSEGAYRRVILCLWLKSSSRRGGCIATRFTFVCRMPIPFNAYLDTMLKPEEVSSYRDSGTGWTKG